MSNENIFSALAKYSSANEEDYLTEAFVFLINALFEKELSVALEILTKLCLENSGFTFDGDEKPSVTTQQLIEPGRLDIQVSSPNKLIYIEVKDRSPVNPEQLTRYKEHLDSQSASVKRLILLTRFAEDLGEHQRILDKHVRWFEVFNWLAEVKEEAKDPVSVYLIESFKSFLEAKQMSIEKVGWEYINGVPAFNNLINMIEAAISNAGIPFYPTFPRAAAWESKGFWLEDREFWCGIHYNNPLVVTFELADKKKFNAKLVETPIYTVREGKERLWFRLPLEDKRFFALNKDEQLAEITKFVKECYTQAKQMRIR